MLKKGKLLVSLVMLMLVVWTVGSVSSLATDIAGSNTTNTPVITTITAAPANNTTNNTTNNTANNVVNNTNIQSISGTVKNNTVNSSSYNTTNSTKLPYAGSNSSVIFIVLAFALSAAYAYKKVTEYNV